MCSKKSPEPTIARCIGPSTDLRTNRWDVECCACGKHFVPLTTRLATQGLSCPKCGTELLAKYNEEPPRVYLCREQAE